MIPESDAASTQRVIAAMLTASGGAAQAHSCMSLADHYVVSCEQGRCTPLFRAVQVPQYGQCRRVTRVEPFPDWAKEPILALATDAGGAAVTPVVISVECLRHFPEGAHARGELGHLMVPPEIVEHGKPPAVVRAWYENRGASEARGIRKREVVDITIYLVAILALTGGTIGSPSRSR